MTLEEENKSLKYENEKLHSLVIKAWHIIGLLEKADMSDEIKAAIKTWCFLQARATKNN